MTEPSIDLILPAYNEAKRIVPTLRDYLSVLPANVRLVVVANNCSDDTVAVVSAVQKDAPGRLHIIDIPGVVGKGGAIIRGWKESNAEFVGFVDADGSTSAAEYNKLITTLLNDNHDWLKPADGIIASRFRPGAEVHNRQSPWRTVMSRMFSGAVTALFRLPFSDTQCGAKLFRREVVASVLPNVSTADMNFDVELLWRLNQMDARILEIPTIWYDKEGSAALGTKRDYMRVGGDMLRGLIRLRFRA